MAQTQTDPSQSTPTPPPAVGADDDPLAHLHKMSTTAGLGSGDYVAVNGTAVFALLVGLASALALMSEVLLILPLVAIVASVMAWQQIRNSNGTQTGKGLAIAAMVLALGFGGFVFGRWATEDIRTRGDRKLISQLINDFAAKLKADDIAGAYGMFSPRFQERVDQTKFADRLKILQDFYGKLARMEWNGLVDFQTDENTGDRYAITAAQVYFEKAPTPIKDTIALQKTAGGWQFSRMEELFPPPAPPPGQGQRGSR